VACTWPVASFKAACSSVLPKRSLPPAQQHLQHSRDAARLAVSYLSWGWAGSRRPSCCGGMASSGHSLACPRIPIRPRCVRSSCVLACAACPRCRSRGRSRVHAGDRVATSSRLLVIRRVWSGPGDPVRRLELRGHQRDSTGRHRGAAGHIGLPGGSRATSARGSFTSGASGLQTDDGRSGSMMDVRDWT